MKCPCCGAELGVHVALGGESASPQSGDVTMCGTCEVFLQFAGAFGVGVQKMSPADFARLPGKTRDELLLGRARLRMLREVLGRKARARA
jgi:hypothetical protein